MKLLITGGAGYIGSHVVLASLEKGYEVTVLDDLSNSNELNFHLNCELIVGSTRSRKDLFQLFSDNKFDGVIHLAGSKAAGESMSDPKKYSENNIIGGLNLINKCVKYGVKTFIFASSAAVYGIPEYIPVNESHSTKPKNYYGYTKLLIERNLDWYSRTYGLNYASLRYFNAAGYDIHKRIIGKERNAKNLIPLIMESAIGERPCVSIFGNNYNTKDGTGIRDYVHVSDLANAHVLAFEYLIYKKKNLVANLGSQKGFSVLEILKIAKKVTKIDIHHKVENPRLGDVSKLVADSSLAKKTLGWDQAYSNLETIIQSTWNIYKK